MNYEIKEMIDKLEKDGLLFANELVNDIIAHFNLLKIEVTKMSVIRVLTKCTNDISIKYENNDRQGFYDLYKIIVVTFKIKHEQHFTTD